MIIFKGLQRDFQICGEKREQPRSGLYKSCDGDIPVGEVQSHMRSLDMAFNSVSHHRIRRIFLILGSQRFCSSGRPSPFVKSAEPIPGPHGNVQILF